MDETTNTSDTNTDEPDAVLSETDNNQNTNAMTHPTTKNETRDGRGRYARGLDTAERDAQAARLRTRGYTYRAIATELGIDVHTAHDAVQRVLQATVEEPAADLRRVELERLDMLVRKATDVLDAFHHVVSNRGDVVEYNGQPLEDDGPVLAAINTLIRVSESRRKLLGLDAETKVNISGGVRYEVVGVDDADLT